MSWNPVIQAASALMPQPERATWAEQWRADMSGARELGVSRVALAGSMIGLALASFGTRPSHGRTAALILLAVIAGATAVMIPPLAVIYVAVASLVVAIAGARRGVRELRFAAVGIIAAIGAAATAVALVDERGAGGGVAFVVALFAASSAVTVLAFGRVWAPRSSRPAAAWTAVSAIGLAGVGILVALVSARVGLQIAAAEQAASAVAAHGTTAVLSAVAVAVLAVVGTVAGALAATGSRTAA